MPIYSSEFVSWIKALPMSSRAARARDHLLEYGSLTTEQLSEMGYVHPPRAIGDLKDAGATIEGDSVKGSTGRTIRRYTLIEQMSMGKAGRVGIPKRFRDALNAEFNFRCGICHGQFEARELQADHRVPFIVAGDKSDLKIKDFMPLCASDNRSKSWSCENCQNLASRDESVCESCFWAHPENYTHVATKQERRVNLTFQGDEIATSYEAIKEAAHSEGLSIEEWLKGKFSTDHD
ncbi:hypothetical protein ACGFSB_24965 [Streptomyces sp. NPDC048441]|uniref:hypothetical protein n=1 Tax=Streptomyces sp. NPDC048441 TaxID=3365552 RepID=UPI0037206E3B